MILTATPKVAINFGTPQQTYLDEVSLAEILQWHADGQFPPGSMGPKIEAAVRFLRNGGERVIIGDLSEAMACVRGEAGTHIFSDNA